MEKLISKLKKNGSKQVPDVRKVAIEAGSHCLCGNHCRCSN